jgi:CheY-like chemotaxis protein
VLRRFEVVPAVTGNEARLGQVLLNLIINAAQAMPEGAADQNEIRITLRRGAAGATVILEVSDTGPGIPRDLIPRIFDPFFTTKPVGVGTGLGLTICHGIVTALGGHIEVDSVVGKGTTFRVLLPASDQVPDRGSVPDLDPSPGGPPMRVLVIDDEAAIGRAIALTLDRHDVVMTEHAREALGRIAAGERFDVILCDVMMPETTGMDFYEQLEAIAPQQRARVVFLTGGTFTDRARRFLERVPNERLDKPFTAGRLAAVIDRVSKK